MVLALPYTLEKRYDEANSLMEQVVHTVQAVPGGHHYLTQKATLGFILILMWQCEYEKAVGSVRLMARSAADGEANQLREFLDTAFELGVILYSRPSYGTAAEMLTIIAKGLAMTLGPEHPATPQAMLGLAEAQMAQNRLEAAEATYQVVIDARSETLALI
ncbi:MAG: hypothetical protein LQ340_006269, partial [Diploschistes diacapsis]